MLIVPVWPGTFSMPIHMQTWDKNTSPWQQKTRISRWDCLTFIWLQRAHISEFPVLLLLALHLLKTLRSASVSCWRESFMPCIIFLFPKCLGSFSWKSSWFPLNFLQEGKSHPIEMPKENFYSKALFSIFMSCIYWLQSNVGLVVVRVWGLTIVISCVGYLGIPLVPCLKTRPPGGLRWVPP